MDFDLCPHHEAPCCCGDQHCAGGLLDGFSDGGWLGENVFFQMMSTKRGSNFNSMPMCLKHGMHMCNVLKTGSFGLQGWSTSHFLCVCAPLGCASFPEEERWLHQEASRPLCAELRAGDGPSAGAHARAPYPWNNIFFVCLL